MINTHNCLQCLNSCWFYLSACLLVFRCFPGSCRFHCSRNPPRFAGSPYEFCDMPRLCFKIHAFCWLNHSNPLICWLNFDFRCRNPTSFWSGAAPGPRWRDFECWTGGRPIQLRVGGLIGSVSQMVCSGWSGWPGWQGRGFL